VFKSKRVSLLTILALLIPTSAGFGISAANAATDLAVFTVNGEDVSSVSTLTLDPYTTSVAVVATPSEAGATTAITLNGTANGTSVAEGNNTLSVVVTDAGSATETKTVTLVVPKGDKTDSVIVVNQEELINGEGTEVDWGTTSVPVSVTLADAAATVKVNGVALTKVGAVATGSVTGLTTGDNDVRVVVTAADGVFTDETQLTVTVLLNTDTKATFAVDGRAVLDGGSVTISKGATEADVAVTTRDENATVEIVGGMELNAGDNQVEIYVTAEDRTTVDRYDITIVVPANDDATLADLTINGTSYSDNEDVLLPYQTTSVNIGIVLNDIDASYVIEGGRDLTQGDNALIITVTAFDNIATETYTLNLLVGNPDVTLSGIRFNGAPVAVDGAVETYLLANTLAVTTTDPRATVTVDGWNAATGALTLPAGSNDVEIVVLGDDKKTTETYTFTVLKAGFEVDFGGEATAVVTNGSRLEVPAKTKEVTVDVTAPVSGSVVEIEGATGLEPGVNEVVVLITYPDLTEVVTRFQVVVLPDSTELTLTVAGDDVTFLANRTAAVTLEAGTTDVDVTVETVDIDATFVITGDTGLVLGDSNRLTVVLKTADGQVVTYTVAMTVLASTDATIEEVSVNGEPYAGTALIEVDSGVVDVQVDTATTATVAITGVATTGTIGGNFTNNSGVIKASGYVTVTVVVTAQDGVTKTSRVINLLASSDMGVFNGSNPSDDEVRVGTYAKVDSANVAAALAQAGVTAGTKPVYKWTANGAVVAGATTSRLLLTPAHLSTETVPVAMRPVVSTGSGATLKTFVGKTFDVALGIIKKAPTPTVLGKSAIGQNLKAISKDWSDGVVLSYKWYINYEDETTDPEAETDEFLLTSEVAVGAKITLGVVGTLAGYETVEKLSAPLTVTAGTIKITKKPSFDDASEFLTGKDISVDPGTSIPDDAEVAYEWTRDGQVIKDATNVAIDTAEYTLTGADFSKKLAVKVTYSAQGYTSVSFMLKTPTIKVATLEDVDAPTITAAGSVLTAVAGFSTDAPTTSKKYVWSRNGRVITDAKSSTYTLKAKDVKGTKITVRVIANYLGYKSTSVISDPDAPFVVPAN